jgi:hypothetical protein
MKKIKIVLIVIGILGTATVAIINVALNPNAPIGSNWTLQNLEAFTEESSSEGGGTHWIRNDQDCVYTFTTAANAEITILGGIKIKANASGIATYTVTNGKTHCTVNGQEQCTARYCPTIPGGTTN